MKVLKQFYYQEGTKVYRVVNDPNKDGLEGFVVSKTGEEKPCNPWDVKYNATPITREDFIKAVAEIEKAKGRL